MDAPETTEPSGAGRRLVSTKTPGVYKRGGRYAVRFRDPSGKVRQRSARTLAEARRLRSELGADVARGEYRADTKVTFAAYAEAWKASYTGRTGRGIRPETLREYHRDLAQAVERLGRMRLAEVTPADVKGYGRTLAEEGFRPATIRRKLAPVKALFATAVEEGVIRSNPTAGVRVGVGSADLVPEEERVKVLAPVELERLLAEVPDGWRRLFVRLLAQTALRQSEGLGLRWRDLDLSGRRLHVRQRVRDGQVGAPKSGRGRREVPLSPGLARELAEHRLRSEWSGDEHYVFSGAEGRPLQGRDCYRWYKPAAARAGVPRAGFHALRHTAASRWLLSGVTIAQVARLLGHHDPGFTLKVYISIMPSDLPSGEELAAAVGLD